MLRETIFPPLKVHRQCPLVVLKKIICRKGNVFGNEENKAPGRGCFQNIGLKPESESESVTLLLAVYHQSVRVGDKSLETHDQ
jgi:hypothetical protein